MALFVQLSWHFPHRIHSALSSVLILSSRVIAPTSQALLHTRQPIQSSDGFKIEAFDDFIPVILVENRRDQNHPYDEWDKDYIEADLFKITKDIMLGRNYGFVLSFDDFFNFTKNSFNVINSL